MARSKGAGAKRKAESQADCCGEECCGNGSSCCGVPVAGCCEVQAVVSVDSRGQMVLPKDVRSQLGIQGEDKLAVVSWKNGEKVCCLTLFKVSELADSLRKTYGPMLAEIVRA